MSNGKRKNLAQNRNAKRNEEIQELMELKASLENRLKEQKKEKFKQLNIRNLKFVGHTCNFLMPFILSTGIFVGAFKLCGGGFPFHTDDITKYKYYNLDFDTKGYVTMDEKYITHEWYDDPLPSNSLIVYSPWIEDNNQYIRFKREYNIGQLTSLDLYDVVLNGNYDYIEQNMTDYKEEIQTSNYINKEETNDYVFKAKLHVLDKDDTLVYSETDLKNILVTFFEMLLGLGFGTLFAYKRDFNYTYRISKARNNYYRIVADLGITQHTLDNTNQKLLSLTNNKGGKQL